MGVWLVVIAVFIAVTALVAGIFAVVQDKQGAKVENRLDMVTSGGPGLKDAKGETGMLIDAFQTPKSIFEPILSRFTNLELLFEQADTSLTISKLVLLCVMFAGMGVMAAMIMGAPLVAFPIFMLMMSTLPFLWLKFRRKRRLKAFSSQLPDALDMLSRSLRAGQSLSSGFNVVSNEMSAPIGVEFGRIFEEQNLGVSIEDSLEDMSNRVPDLDLKFFCTAVILQRQTGGDLAEILDKISYLIRERFKILGQVQALTGEGRLSGIVLLALPVLLFGVVYKLNPDYIMVLFREPLGKKMLIGAIIMQVFGALVIRKIVNIKV
ncbi:MAG: type II secretion system F family protein [Planctomycetia bacterium]|jgi:tight adherence protein B